ncbi:sugar phosphate isomerase/epimerase family protein [Persicirhabdus sediminis]|nr:sugar phosphate isomerase/epimerase [Persicirhabdus sediminis]
MKKVMSMVAMAALSAGAMAGELEFAKENPLKRDKSAAAARGWEIGVQVWTFGAYSLEDQLALCSALDLDFIELGPKVKFSQPEEAQVALLQLDDKQAAYLKKLLADHDLNFKQLYVHIPGTRENWEAFMKFAQQWGVDTLVAEPKYENLAMVDELAQQYKIKVAIHNHPNLNNKYWKPEMATSRIGELSEWVGLNPDLGHWIRMGVNPAEEVKKTEVRNRLVSLHFNDCEELGANKSPHCVTGSGAGQLDDMMKTLRETKFTGRFAIEYAHWNNNFQDVQKIVQYFDEQAK